MDRVAYRNANTETIQTTTMRHFMISILVFLATGVRHIGASANDLRSCEAQDGTYSFNAACNTEYDAEEPHPMCHPGQKRIGCSNNTSCQACDEGHFQPYYNFCTDKCQACAVCGPHQEIEHACTDVSDTVCRDRETSVSAPDTTHTGSSTPPNTDQTGGSTPSDISQPGVYTPISEHPSTTSGSPFQTENDGRNQSTETPNSGPSTQQNIEVVLALMTLVAVIAICCCCVYRRRYKALRGERERDVEYANGHCQIQGDVERQGVATHGDRGQGSRQDGDDEHAAETDGLMQDSQAVPVRGSCAGPSQHGTHGGRGHEPASPTLSQGPKKKNRVCRTVGKLVGKHKCKGKGKTKPPRCTEPESLGLQRRAAVPTFTPCEKVHASTCTCNACTDARGTSGHAPQQMPPQSAGEPPSSLQPPINTSGSQVPSEAVPTFRPCEKVHASTCTCNACTDANGSSGHAPQQMPPQSAGEPPSSLQPPINTSGNQVPGAATACGVDPSGTVPTDPEKTCTERFLFEVTDVVSLIVVMRLCIHLGLKQKDIDNVKDAPDKGDAESQGYKMLHMVLRQNGRELTYSRVLNALKDIGETNGADQLVEKFNIRQE